MRDANGTDRGNQVQLVATLREPARHGRTCCDVGLIETHISYVLLTGEYAYKIKKAVALGFLDFTTRDARLRYCLEELRLNRRLAPALYLDVVAITGTIDDPVIGGSGAPIEYAVKMREFPQDGLLNRELARGELTGAAIDTLAGIVAQFHGAVEVASASGPFGTPHEVLRFALDNFDAFAGSPDSLAERATLAELRAWTEREHSARSGVFASRRREGFIRNCHGDLHLGNITRIDGVITIFDCIEFNEQLRWIDVMSEIAFTTMDLEDRGRPDFARRFLDAYLALTGDYAGLPVLPFYLAYRALVRAKVACLRAGQLAAEEPRAAAVAEFRDYLALARRYASPPHPAIVVTHGLSGSGKTTLSQSLLERMGAVRIRTDLERKRLSGVPAMVRSGSALGAGLYAEDANRATYRRVCDLARGVVAAGKVAVLDGTFLRRWQRDLARALAAELEVPFVVIAFDARVSTLRRRIEERARDGIDASEADLAVLDHQLRTQDPLAPDEQSSIVDYDAEAPLDRSRDPTVWDGVLARIGLAVTAGAAAPRSSAAELAAKVALLSEPHSYPDNPERVERIETHMSWVFLTDRHAYKLKKPVRMRYLDFTTEAARRIDCREELRLNRRLTRDVYLDVLPLAIDAAGRLHLDTKGEVVDWVIKMRRLPGDKMLDRAIRAHAVRIEDLCRAVEVLCDFYHGCPPVERAPDEHRLALAREIADNRRELGRWSEQIPLAQVDSVCARQSALLTRCAELFDARVRAGRIVEGHGDLRPEHICLVAPPQIIDCLEFARELRIVDPADELAFLALECERLGAPELTDIIFTTYARCSGDEPPAALIHFHQSLRACTRAKIALWHLEEPEWRGSLRWAAQANDYLHLAQAHIECGACP